MEKGLVLGAGRRWWCRMRRTDPKELFWEERDGGMQNDSGIGLEVMNRNLNSNLVHAANSEIVGWLHLLIAQ